MRETFISTLDRLQNYGRRYNGADYQSTCYKPLKIMGLDECMLQIMEEAGITLEDETTPDQTTKPQKDGDQQCHICGRTYRSYANLLRNLKAVYKAMTIQCEHYHAFISYDANNCFAKHKSLNKISIYACLRLKDPVTNISPTHLYHG